jgi:hypothetical protein
MPTQALTVTGTTTVQEGGNITITFRRSGDLSDRIYIDLFTHASSGVFPASNTADWQDVQNLFGATTPGGRTVMNPGESQASISYQVYADGVAEGTEYANAFWHTYTDGTNGTPVSIYINSDTTSNPYAPGSGTWHTQITDGATTPSAPVNTPSSPAPATPGVVISGNTYNVDNSTNYVDNSTTNTYYTDNSVNYNNSFNTDNSVNTYNLSYVTNANDYSIGKTIDGSGKLRGTESNDLITGSSSKDRLYGNGGNDELIGSGGKDRLYGGGGSNVFNAGTSASRKDADRLYIQREGSAASADIIEAIGKSDKIYVTGSTGNLSVGSVDGGLGIFDSGVLQAIYTGNNFNASRLDNMLVAA